MGWGSLSNGGETITMLDSADRSIFSFEYDDRDPWPDAADGAGPSLVLVNPTNTPDHSDPANWRASIVGGTPGRGDEAIQQSFADWMAEKGFDDPLADPDGNGLNHLLTFGLGVDLAPNLESALPFGMFINEGDARIPALSFRVRNGTDLVFTLESSTELKTWGTEPAHLQSTVDNGDGTSTLTFRPAAAPTSGDAKYLRLRVAAP